MTDVKSVTDSPPVDTSNLRIPWPALSVGLAIVTLVSLGTLVVIVSVKDVDILSTVALALAILSFAAQLIVSMLQTESSAKLNGSTESALAEMRATTESLLTNQRDQFDRVLGAALKAIPAAVEDVAAASEDVEGGETNGSEDAVSADAFQESLSLRMREILERESGKSSGNDITISRRLLPSDLDQHPTEEAGRAALERLRALSPVAIPALITVAEKIRTAEKNGRTPVAHFTEAKNGKPGPSFQALIDAGLIERGDVMSTNGVRRSQYLLTDEGRITARLLLPRVAKPKWLLDALN